MTIDKPITEKNILDDLHKDLGGQNALNTLMMERLNRVRRLVQQSGSATLILGAGINGSVGLPGWDALLGRLLLLITSTSFKRPDKAYPKYERRDLTGYANAENPYSADALEVAEYIYNVLPSWSLSPDGKLVQSDEERDQSLKVLVREAMAPKDPKTLDDMNRLKDTALGCIAELAFQHFQTRTCTGDLSRRNVLTYNYDNLLEHCLCASHPDLNVQSLYDRAEEDPNSDLHIYHPHGYLDLTHPHGAESRRIILAESSYIDIEHRNYNWVNYLLARALHDNICLVFGFSGIDYNFKRIMKHLDDEEDPDTLDNRCKRYIFVSISRLKKALFGSEEMLTGGDAQRLCAYLALKENYWRRKGFLPIWVTHESLPKLIRYLT